MRLGDVEVKAVRRAGWGVVERVPKTAPKGAVFCHPFTGTETYAARRKHRPGPDERGKLRCPASEDHCFQC
jgi:hypothetical protein